MEPEVSAALVGAASALVVSGLGYFIQRSMIHKEMERDAQRIRGDLLADYQRDKDQIRTEFMAEQVARSLLLTEKWSFRSFAIIRHHLGGFLDDELRRILVRAEAIRFKSKSGEELWGLVERNENHLSVWRVDADPENFPSGELYGCEPQASK